MKIIVISIVTLAVLGGVVGVGMTYTGGGGDAPGDRPETAVRVDTVTPGDLVEIVSAPGQIQPKTKVSISARTTARIMALPFEEGATVKKDQLIVQLDAKDLEASLNAAQSRYAAQEAQIEVGQAQLKAQESQIQAARVQLADAERDYKRQRELLATQDVSQQVVDAAQAKVDQLKAQLDATISSLEADRAGLTVQRRQLEVASADIVRAKDNLSYTTITSPIDGIITRLNGKVGEMVVTGTMNNAGTVILEVSDLSEMQVDAQVDESNITDVREGQKAKVRISAFPDQTFDGTVKLVGLDVAEQRGGNQSFGGGSQQGKWYRAKIVVATESKRIPAGLSADVDIETERHVGVIKVPTQAVMGRPIDDLPAAVKDRPEVDKNKTLATVVYKFEGGKAVATPVTIGASDMTHTQITAGLKVGDRIITGPYKILPSLAHDQKVKEDAATTKPTTGTTTKAS